jgi:hypothetical protein
MKTINVSMADRSLFHVASREYNDATAWRAIALANNLTDPVISSMMTLIIPSYNKTFSGSLPQ